MTNIHLITNSFPPISLLCYDRLKGSGHMVWERRRVTFASIHLYQKFLRISLVEMATAKLHLLMNKNPAQASNYHTMYERGSPS